MNKLLLLFCASMLVHISHAQYSVLTDPSISNIGIDPKNIVADFSYVLKEKTKVRLRWTVTNIEATDFLSIERSANGKDFEMIGILKLLSANKFELMDESPLRGRSLYRIRTSVKGKTVFSKTLEVYMGGVEAPFKFYPNPADNVLIVRADIPLDVQIADASGAVRISQARVQGLQTLNLSTLEKGIYTIRFINKLSNTVSIEKLFKN